MKLQLLILYFLTGWVFFSSAQEMEIVKADSLVIETDAKTALEILHNLDSLGHSGISFRVQVLEAIVAGTSNEETAQNIEALREKYRDANFSSLAKVVYLNYFSEIMGPDNNWNEFNLSFLNSVLKIYDEGGEQDSFMLMHMLHNKGNLLHKLYRHDEAIQALQNSVDIAENIDTRDSSLLAIILFNLANPYYSIGQFQKSYELVERCEQYLSSLKNPNLDYFQTVYLDLFSSSLDFGNMEKAENYLNKAARLYESKREEMTGGDKGRMERKEISLLYNYMRLYSYKEDHESAHEILRETQLKFVDDNSDYIQLRVAAIFNIMGDMYVIDEPEKSFKFYERAIEIYDKDDLTYSLMFEFNLGKAYLNSKQYEKSEKITKTIIAKGESKDDYRLPYFYFLDAKRHLELGEFTKSLPSLNLLANVITTSETEIDLLSQIGVDEFINMENIDFAYLLNDAAETIEMEIEKSQDTYLVMNSLWRMAISNFQSTFKQVQFNEKSQRQYEIMLNGLLKTDDYLGSKSMSYEEVIKFSENSTSRVLWEQFKLKNQGLELVDRSFIVEEQKIRAEITSLKKERRNLDSIQVDADIFELELALEKNELEKRKKNNSFYKYEDFTFDFTAFQQKLATDELVLKFEYLDSILYRYEITKDHLVISPIDSLTRIDGKIERFTKLIRNPSSDIPEIQKLGNELAGLLLPEKLPENLVFVSDGVLNYLPFDLLRINDKYLLESHIISNTTSLALLEIVQKDNEIKKSMIFAPSYDEYTLSSQQLAVRGDAYNLDGALAEAEAISEIIKSDKWLREEALKDAFVENAGKYDLLHLSMHSFMNDDDPELSSLVFHDGEEENELYISELYGLNLNAKLAVLSACNTGVGLEKSGEGMVSVNRAFTYAGVPSIISSLWSAPDQATQELMTTFYKELKSGESKAFALRSAKLDYINSQTNEKLKHPFFWGGFVLHGNADALVFQGYSLSEKIFMFLGIAIIGILFLLLIRKILDSKV